VQRECARRLGHLWPVASVVHADTQLNRGKLSERGDLTAVASWRRDPLAGRARDTRLGLRGIGRMTPTQVVTDNRAQTSTPFQTHPRTG
jgi:hypothetical protein